MKNLSHTVSESAADLNLKDTAAAVHASPADVREMIFEMHPSGSKQKATECGFSQSDWWLDVIVDDEGNTFSGQIPSIIGWMQALAVLSSLEMIFCL
ncbi:hypothetical protein BUALT_Bualt14G0111600 [Buddleja alternifolia]|uniref:Uncharacterized protein n=1 Tax=Buddleja alternifolia TaxID=168488 RepID=A0AAV6WIQ7_9LAMI|nr:hypothetical protein BUALT_Bualt14G0111600 [Buddleja alternifolia]